MTKEDKELLLKDLCARLPYGVKIKRVTQRADACQAEVSFTERLDVYTLKVMMEFKKEDFPFFMNKPYLFPLSSMTKEQKEEMNSFDPFETKETKTFGQWAVDLIDFYNRHHLDYRGLIKKGLAIDATALHIY
jgi:hypothetical protein